MAKVKYTDINGNNGEIESNKLFFRPSVYGVLIEDGKILLSPQWDGYDFPGGGMKIGETVTETLEREFWEETGIKVRRGEVVACESNFFKLPHSKDNEEYCNSITMYYVCEKIGGELSTDNFDEYEKEYVKMPEWINLDDIKKIKFYNSINSVKIISRVIEIIK